MNLYQAKADARKRLHARGVTVTKLQAKTVSFQGFGYHDAVFVYATVKVDTLPFFPGGFGRWIEQLKEEIPAPSKGGYVLNIRLGAKGVK